MRQIKILNNYTSTFNTKSINEDINLCLKQYKVDPKDVINIQITNNNVVLTLLSKT